MNDTLAEPLPDHAQNRSIRVGLIVLTVSMIGLAGLQYLMPKAFDNPPGVSQGGLDYFRSAFPALAPTELSVAAFAWTFRLLLTVAWIGYVMVLVSGYRSGTDLGRRTVPAIGLLAVAVALLFPPSLSSDVFAYAGWGRMLVLHGWSPYAHTLTSLAGTNDPAGLIAPVAATSTHGPVWIAVVSSVVGLLQNAGLWSQILAFKALAGLALVAAAVAGREIARFYDARNANLTALAIGLNPLFLIEGPGNGHNDVLMIALLLAGIACCQRARMRTGFLLVGLSIGIKFVTAAIVPWLIFDQITRHPRRAWLAPILVAIGLALAPTVGGYAALGAQTNPLAGIRTVFERQVVTDDTAALDSTQTGSAPVAPSRSGPLPRLALLLGVYAALSVMVWRSAGEARYLSCWALFCLTLVVIGAPVPFAWYMIWPFSAAVLRWDKYGCVVTATCVVLSMFLLLQYTVLYAR